MNPKSFAEAQRYCRENHIDLVTVEDWTDMEELLALENFTSISAWIGLRKTEHELWRWALADPEFYKDGETEYRNWGPNEPTNHIGEYIVQSWILMESFVTQLVRRTGSSYATSPDLSGNAITFMHLDKQFLLNN